MNASAVSRRSGRSAQPGRLLEESRSAAALYYFTNGRPAGEVKVNRGTGDTLWAARPGEKLEGEPRGWKEFARRLVPPILVDAAKSLTSK